MNIRIEITDPTVHTRNVQTRNGPMTFHDQIAYLHRPGLDYPERMKLTLERERKGEPYPVGDYTLSPESFYVDRFRSLGCSPRLVAVNAK